MDPSSKYNSILVSSSRSIEFYSRDQTWFSLNDNEVFDGVTYVKEILTNESMQEWEGNDSEVDKKWVVFLLLS